MIAQESAPVSTILKKVAEGNGQQWFSVNGLKCVLGKWNGDRVAWLDEPELCTYLQPDDVFCYEGEYYRAFSPRPGHMSMWKLTDKETDVDGFWYNLDVYDSIQAEQAYLLGRS
jgi:hypothetical protein